MKKAELFFFTFIIFLQSKPVYAQVDIGSIYPLAGHDLGYYISPIIRTAIVVAGIITFLLIVGGGIGMITSAGNPQQQEKGRNAVTAGVMGLALVVSAVWILEILKIITGFDLLNPGV